LDYINKSGSQNEYELIFLFKIHFRKQNNDIEKLNVEVNKITELNIELLNQIKSFQS
jgi:hypothetical protein